MSKLKRVKILNPSGPNRSTRIINGDTSGILNWNDISYPQFYDLYRTLLGNFWIAHEVNMSKDVKTWTELSNREQDAFKKIIGLLATLDAPQTRYMYNVAEYVTDPSVHAITAIIAQQEVVHNESYSYVLSSIVPLEEQKAVFEIARTDKVINKRNKLIMDLYDDFLTSKTGRTLLKSLVGSAILEGINFYSGFAYFYNLARQQKMVGTSTMISYINRDEMQHGYFVTMLIRAILAENPEYDSEGQFTDFAYKTISKAVDLEIEWSEYVLQGIEGIDLLEMKGYVKYRANKMLRMMGLSEIYEGYDENVMPWIKAYSDKSFNTTKTDFFEQKSRQYTKTTDLNGFDDL